MRLRVLLALLLGCVVLTPFAGLPGAAGEAPAFTRQTLHFRVVVGPTDKVCDIVGDLYLPAGASSSHRVPAVLTTNGFGGSKDDQTGIGEALAERGYAVLSYSGLGFGGSSCKITLDDPDWDGRAASQLVSYLGGKAGTAFLDARHTRAAPRLTSIVRDRRDADGRRSAHDPRVGTIGGSYGGGFQFAVASVDARVDALVPLITWNDLSYSLAPNGTDQTGVSSVTPGAAKLLWATGFSLLGMTSDLLNKQVPPDLLTCPNFADFVCPALLAGGTTGHLLPAHIRQLRHASVASYVERIRVPVLLMQGQRDTLFNLNEAVATYRALERQGTEVKMVWHQWGHSGGAAPGEIDLDAPDPAAQYETGRVMAWFDHYLKGEAVGTGPEFAYFRDWVDYAGNARPAYATSSAYPVGSQRRLTLSGAGELTAGAAAPGTQRFLTPAAGAPTTLNDADVLGSFVDVLPKTVTELPGTYADWSTPVLTAPVDVAGVPTVRLQVKAPTAVATQALGATGKLVLFVKVADVAPDGTARLINGLEAPVRVPDARKPFSVSLPGIVHRFEKGHRIRLIVSGGSLNYRGGLTPTPVAIAAGDGQTLHLPVVD